MNRNIESVASIFLEQMHEVERDLENVKQAKESWGSKQATPVDNDEYFQDEGYEIDEYVSDLEEETTEETVMKSGNDKMNEGSLEDIFSLSGTLTSEYETDTPKVRNMDRNNSVISSELGSSY